MKSSDGKRSTLLCVTGMGMVASLGVDVATNCAAARAGLSRARPIAAYPVVDADDGSDVGVVGHCAPFGTSGFEGPVRLLQLARLGLHDLVRRQPALLSLPGLHVYLSLPPWRAAADEPDKAVDEAPVRDAFVLATELWAEAARGVGWREVPTLRHLAIGGHTGFARAIERAAADIHVGAVQRAIVGGVDSLVDIETLAWLEARQRLKTPENPVGLQPGEAGVFVLLETDEARAARAAPAHALIRGLAFGDEPHLPDAEDPPSGRGLAQALHGVVSGIRFKHQLPLWCLSDQNGEPYRAMDWGCAEVHIEAAHKMRVVGGLTHCAASYGDTGAASGGVALCTAASAFERGYAPAALAAVVSAADTGERAVLLCQAAA